MVFSPELVLGGLPESPPLPKRNNSAAMPSRECTSNGSGRSPTVGGEYPAVAKENGVGAEPGASAFGEGGSPVAGERNVGSAAMARLLLFFVRLMDKVADREYVLLLCGGERGGGADRAGGGGGGGREGWVTWGRFSLLGQMHSLLPRR